MSTLLRASDLAKKPVVTFGGEDVAQIKDIVYGANGGRVEAFTLAGRGLFAGPLKTALPWPAVVGLGPDAVIVESEAVFVPRDEVLASAAASSGGAGVGDVLGSEVLTDQGTALGRVRDVVIGILPGEQAEADVVGYEIDPAETLNRGQQTLLIPLPDTISASGTHLMVPASATQFLTDNMEGFGNAVDAFRRQLHEGAV
ncbi:PRC-barrel domain-containing protein [Nakamurella endophytica]|uniref:PRC-barrel domain-containing protein n=1 Tax=Nakamurella endophytica TaxID=1748367 RepID=A0A917WIL9_9ACTN|nr:PRC-barrel domain-containing protein [Nakamurella endophytica]GGM07784.1 hypothetical protein GCM10011594_29680 [Nakamurella endophytica]